MRIVREIENGSQVEIGKFYVYEYHNILHVGEAVPSKKGYKWAMRNLNTNNIEYPYNSEVFETEQPCMRVFLTYGTSKSPIGTLV